MLSTLKCQVFYTFPDPPASAFLIHYLRLSSPFRFVCTLFQHLNFCESCSLHVFLFGLNAFCSVFLRQHFILSCYSTTPYSSSLVVSRVHMSGSTCIRFILSLAVYSSPCTSAIFRLNVVLRLLNRRGTSFAANSAVMALCCTVVSFFFLPAQDPILHLPGSRCSRAASGFARPQPTCASRS